MSYMQVTLIDGKQVPTGPVLGNKPEESGQIWLPVLESQQTVDPLFQTRVYIVMGSQIIEHIHTDESKLYLAQRKYNYPSITDQLDTIYHEGVDAWKEKIAEIKAAYPKPTDSGSE